MSELMLIIVVAYLVIGFILQLVSTGIVFVACIRYGVPVTWKAGEWLLGVLVWPVLLLGVVTIIFKK